MIHSFHTSMILYKSEFKSGRVTCVSGSPNRQLNSNVFGPSDVNIIPAYNTPETLQLVIKCVTILL